MPVDATQQRIPAGNVTGIVNHSSPMTTPARPIRGVTGIVHRRCDEPRQDSSRGSGERYELVLRAEPWGTPATIRLRRLLKTALRSFGLKCVELREVNDVNVKAAESAMAGVKLL